MCSKSIWLTLCTLNYFYFIFVWHRWSEAYGLSVCVSVHRSRRANVRSLTADHHCQDCQAARHSNSNKTLFTLGSERAIFLNGLELNYAISVYSYNANWLAAKCFRTIFVLVTDDRDNQLTFFPPQPDMT